MFFQKRTIIFVTQGKIRSAVFSGGKLVRQNEIFDWTEETLATVLQKIAATGPNRARIVFGEEFAYVTVIKSAQIDRRNILDEAREVMPDEISQSWDFKKEKIGDAAAQVAAIQPKLFETFNAQLTQAGFSAEALEPQSVAVARLLSQSSTFLFVVRDEKVLLGAVKDGVVIATQVAAEQNWEGLFKVFLVYVQKKNAGVIEKVFVGSGIDAQAAIFSANNLQVEAVDLDSLRGMALKKDLTGKDERVLNIVPKKSVAGKSVPKKTGRQISFREKFLAIVFISVLLIGTVLVRLLKH